MSQKHLTQEGDQTKRSGGHAAEEMIIPPSAGPTKVVCTTIKDSVDHDLAVELVGDPSINGCILDVHLWKWDVPPHSVPIVVELLLHITVP